MNKVTSSTGNILEWIVFCDEVRVVSLSVYSMFTRWRKSILSRRWRSDAVLVDLFFKLGCLLLFLNFGLLQLLKFCHFFFFFFFTLFFSYFFFFLTLFFVWLKPLREAMPISDRKAPWRTQVSGLFFHLTDTEREGELFSCCGDKRSLLFFRTLLNREGSLLEQYCGK